MPTQGMVLADKYRLEAEIGRGGMGSVWRAKRLDLDADVAVKVLHVEASQRADLLERFSREAKATASLSSPHVIRIIDFGVDAASEHAFLVMELLEGETLRERMNRERPLPLAAVTRVLTQVGRALAQAHSVGIVHRDLKPGNIFLVQNADEELVKLLDFGIAKTEEAQDEVLLTQTGNVLGTPQYMSPEQLNSSKGVDHRSDLWSLAVIAYECLVGRRPFRGATIGELAMKISVGRCEPPSSVAPVPPGFDEWFARAVEIAPERRFQSATELTLALQRLSAGTPLLLPSGASPGAAALAAVSAEVMAAGVTPTIGEGLELAETEAASVTGNTNAAVSSPVTARAARRRAWPRGLAIAAASAGVLTGAYLVVVATSRSAPSAETRETAASAARPVEVSAALRGEPQSVTSGVAAGLAAPALVGAGSAHATLMAPPAAAARLVEPSVRATPGTPATSEEPSSKVRARARGKAGAARAGAEASDVRSPDAAPRKRRASRRKSAPQSIVAPAAEASSPAANPLDAYDRP